MVTRPLTVRLNEQLRRFDRAISPRSGLTRRQARSMKESAVANLRALVANYDHAGLKAALVGEAGLEDVAARAAVCLIALTRPEAGPADRYEALKDLGDGLEVLTQAIEPPPRAASTAGADQAGAGGDAPAWSSRKDLFG